MQSKKDGHRHPTKGLAGIILATGLILAVPSIASADPTFPTTSMVGDTAANAAPTARPATAAQPDTAQPAGWPTTKTHPVRPADAHGSPMTIGDGWFSLLSRNAFDHDIIYVLGISGSSDANGAKVIQWPFTAQPSGQAIPDQDWHPFDAGSGYINLRNAGTSDWKALGISASSTADGGKAIQWTFQTTTDDQDWKIVPVDDTWFRLQNRHSGKCLAIPAGSLTQGTQAIQWTCGSGHEQQWAWLDS